MIPKNSKPKTGDNYVIAINKLKKPSDLPEDCFCNFTPVKGKTKSNQKENPKPVAWGVVESTTRSEKPIPAPEHTFQIVVQTSKKSMEHRRAVKI